MRFRAWSIRPFPVELNAVTRTYFERRAPLENAPDQGRHERHSAHASRCRGRGAPELRPALQLHAAHHLRRHPAQRRPRQQRSAANRAGDRQLPHPARPLARRDASRRWSRVFADPKVTVQLRRRDRRSGKALPESKGFPTVLPPPDVLRPLEKVAAEMWPGAR